MDRQNTVLAVVASTVAASLGLIAMIGRTSAPAATRVEAEADPSQLELETLLREVEAAWQPHARATILAKARLQRDRYLEPLRELLERRNDALPRAIDLAAELELGDLESTLIDIALRGPASARTRAIAAAARVAPFDSRAFRELLDDPDPAIVIATLAAVTPGDSLSWSMVVGLLGHNDESLRAAAIAALPKPLPPELIDLLEMLCDADSVDPELVVEALSCAEPSPEIEALLTRLLRHSDAAVRLLAIDALAVKSGALRDPGAVWSLVENGSSPLEMARALMVLEPRDAFDVEKLRRMLSVMHPLPRYCAARCLLRSGDRAALSELVNLAELPAEAFVGIEPDVAAAVQLSAANIMAELAGTTPFAGAAEWRAWILAQEGVEPILLADPPTALR